QVQRGGVHAVRARPVAEDHRVGVALAQRDADHVASGKLARALGHLLEHGFEIARRIDVGGHAPEYRVLAAPLLLGALPLLLLALAPRLLGLPALGGEALEG